MKVKEVEIKENIRLTETVWLLSVSHPELAAMTRPGQFFNILVSGQLDPLLRRPVSIGDVRGGTLSFFYKVVGKGTAILSAKKKGEEISLMGPLGRGFTLDGESHLLIGGGIGTAPLVYLLRTLLEMKKKAVLHAGFPCEAEDYLTPYDDGGILNEKESFILFTEDGSSGLKGYPTSHMETYPAGTAVHTCGPLPLMKAAERTCRMRGMKSWHSLEERMACGAGACLGCVVQTVSGHRLVCKDGPVFPGEELPWQ
jgi:dihydroorotate dehydrogenase electron transfer subunit